MGFSWCRASPTLRRPSARRRDGRRWLAHLTTHLDHQVTYTAKVADILGAFCDGVVHEDRGAGVLHVYELGLDGAQPIERLALPIATPAVNDLDNFQALATDVDRRPLDLWAFATSRAIGLRSRDSATGVLAAGLLRFETAPWPVRVVDRSRECAHFSAAPPARRSRRSSANVVPCPVDPQASARAAPSRTRPTGR